jgi:membrane peptidoglycan carboxypeptidase
VPRKESLRLAAALAFALVLPSPAAAQRLTDKPARNDVRVRSAAYPLFAGLDLAGGGLPERLERLGYRRVHRRPERAGEFFWGEERFWIYRRAHRLDGDDYPAELIGLAIERGRVAAGLTAEGVRYPLEPRERPWIEPETLAESLIGNRAPRPPLRFDELPERVWRPLLAAEDARFFDHPGLDGRAIARAALANVLAGGVEQGGSTITQQLVKMRSLSPRRSLGRKASEAVRALALEAEHDKEEILEAYLDHVYLGHSGGLLLYGYGAASRAWFGKDARELTLGEAALLAAVIQAPSRLSPERHLEDAERRRQWVLDRVAEHGWASPADIAAARTQPRLAPRTPPRRPAPAFVRWAGQVAADSAPARTGRGRGVVVETTLDAELQHRAERAVEAGLARLRRDDRRLRAVPLAAALVALDAETGAVLAYVGGPPGDRENHFDRARQAERQPGSTVKPLVLLEAFGRCGGREPLNPATRVADRPLTLELPSGPWQPENPDREFRGVVTLRRAVAESLNVPFARAAAWCGFDATAGRLRSAGLTLPDEPPPAFVLGAVETTPLRLAEAYTVFATPGRALRPYPVTRVERPAGGALASGGPAARRVVDPASAYLVRNLLRQAIETGTASAGAVLGVAAVAKTGTSSGSRDAWFAGDVGSVVAVVWVGSDDGTPLRRSGASAAAPIWREFMALAAAIRPPREVEVPAGVIEGFVDPATGRRVREGHRRAESELFRRGAEPPRRRFWRADPPLPPVL